MAGTISTYSSNTQGTHLALEQVPNLLLNALCLAKQTLVDAQTLEAALATADVVDLSGAVLDGTPQEVLGVGAYVMALCLDYRGR